MSLFDTAARVFPVRPDPATGLRVLTLATRAAPPPGLEPGAVLRTTYHQHNPFLDGGRRILFRAAHSDILFPVLDLETGRAARHPADRDKRGIAEVSESGLAACVTRHGSQNGSTILLAGETGEERNRFAIDGWIHPQAKFLDPATLCIGVSQGQYYHEHVRSRFYLLRADGSAPTLILEEEGYFCNHMMPRPGHPHEFSYDRWPCPRRPEPVITRLRAIDGSWDRQVPLAADAPAVGPIWGGQRDHYLWSSDGQYIVSYFSTAPEGRPDHYDFDWWLSRWNVETGRDTAAPYPAERWGCNFAITPDGRYVVSAGGRRFEHLYRVDLHALHAGWNEQVLCAYPHSVEDGANHGPFHMPHVLPDGSGAVFNAGWPGPDDGVYMVELPR